MRVEKKPMGKFQPITITIETEEEAQTLWHILDMPLDPDGVGAYLENSGYVDDFIGLNSMTDTQFEMFRLFDKLYCPEYAERQE